MNIREHYALVLVITLAAFLFLVSTLAWAKSPQQLTTSMEFRYFAPDLIKYESDRGPVNIPEFGIRTGMFSWHCQSNSIRQFQPYTAPFVFDGNQ